METLGEERYRMKRQFDTLEKAVEGKAGPGGTLMDLGIGLGAAGALGKSLGAIADQVNPETRPCRHCNSSNPPGARFCSSCGNPLA